MFKHSLEQQSLAKQPSQLLHRDPLHLPHITVRSINDTRYGTLCTNVNMVGAYDTFKCEHIGGLQKHYRPNFILETGLLCHILLTSQVSSHHSYKWLCCTINTHKVNPLTTWQFNYLFVKKILTPNPSAHGDVALDWAWKFHPRVSFIEGMPEKWLFSCAGKTIWLWASPLYVLRPCVTLLLMYIFFYLFFFLFPSCHPGGNHSNTRRDQCGRLEILPLRR